MAPVLLPTTPRPRYKDTVVCGECLAEYRPGRWVTVRYAKDTTADYRVLGRIPESVCPLCRTPRNGVKP